MRQNGAQAATDTPASNEKEMIYRLRFLPFCLLTAILLATLTMPLSAKRDRRQQLSDTLSANDRKRFDYFYLEALNRQTAKQYDAAFDLLRHCLKINPQSAEAHYLLASYFYELKDDSAALAHFKRAAELSDKNDEYLEKLGQSYINSANYPAAIDAYEKLSGAYPERTDVLNILVQLYQQERNYAKMIATLNRIETVEGKNEDITLAKMRVYSMQNNDKAAYKELKDLCEKYPNDLNYRVMMGNWLLGKKRNKEALAEYNAVLRNEPDNVLAQMSLMDYYREMKQDSLAGQLLIHLLTSRKTPIENKLTLMRQAIAENEQNGGDSTRILLLFKQTLSAGQPHPDMAELRAAYMAVKHMPQDSIDAALHEVLVLSPENTNSRLQLIQSALKRNDTEGIINLCLPALEYTPDEMMFYYFLGIAYYQKGEADKAFDVLSRGVRQITPQSNKEIAADLYAIMGEILHEKGRNKEAFEAYDSCLQWKPDHYPCLNNYAYFLSQTGKNMERAEQMSYRTVAAEPNNATYLDTYAWILFLEKKYEEAKIYIDRAVENDADSSAVILEHAGDIHAMTQNTQRAVELWQSALRHGSKSKTLLRKIKFRKYIKESTQ